MNNTKSLIEALISDIKRNENNLTMSERYDKMLTEYKRMIEVNRDPLISNKFYLSDINQMADDLCQMEAKIDNNSTKSMIGAFMVLLGEVSDNQKTLLALCGERDGNMSYAIRCNHQQLLGTLNAILKTFN